MTTGFAVAGAAHWREKLRMCLAVPGRILEIGGEDALTRTARVSFGGIVRDVSLACVPEARVDDFVLVHVGVALAVLDEREAAEVFTALEQLGELGETPAPPRSPP